MKRIALLGGNWMIFGASPRTPGGKRDTNWIGCSEGSILMIGGRCRQSARGSRDPGSRACRRLQGNLRCYVRGRGLCASRVLEEDAADGETGCGSGGGAVAGTGGVDAMTTEVFDSVWDALEDTPAEPENMKLRSRLMIAINEAVSGWGMTQTDAARRLGVTQPRLNDLLRGRVGKFSLDALVALAARAGLAVHLEFTLAA